MSLAPLPTRASSSSHPLSGFLPAYTWGLRLTVGRRRRMVIVVLLAAGVGALAGWFSGHTERGAALPQEQAAYELWQMLKEAVLPFCSSLVALTLVAGAFQREVSERTLVFHLVRPITRRTLFLARFLAAVTVAIPVALLTPLVTLLVADLPLPAEVYLGFLPVVGLGVLAIGGVTYLLNAWFKHGIVASLVYVFLIDSFLSKANGSMQKLSTLHHVLSIHHAHSSAAFGSLSSAVAAQTAPPPIARDASGVVFSGLDAAQIEWTAPVTSMLVLASVCVVSLALGAWIVSTRDYPLKD